MASARLIRLACTASFVASMASTAIAGDDVKKFNVIDKEAQNTSLFSFNYGPPSSTSVDMLGLDTSKISPSTGLGPFVLSLPAAFDGSGGQYAGIDLSPAWVFQHTLVSAYPLQHDYLREEWLRLRFDLGLTNGSDSKDVSKQKASAIAAGFNAPLLPGNYPLRVRWRGAAEADGPYFQQCLNHSKETFLQLAVMDKSAVGAGDMQAFDFENDLLRAKHNRMSEAEYRAFYGRLVQRWGYPDRPQPETPHVTEADILGNAMAWGRANSSDPTAASVLGLSQMLAAIDRVSVKVPADAIARDDALPPLLAFLKLQPAEKPGIAIFVSLLEKAGIGPAAAPPFEGSTPSLKTIEETYGARISKAADATRAADQKQIEANAKALGTAGIVADCAKGASVLAGAQPDLSVGAGYRRAGEPGHLKNIDDSAYSLWLSWRLPLASGVQGVSNSDPVPPFAAINSGKVRYLMIGGSVRYDHGARFTTGDSTTPLADANKLDAWLGLEGYNGWARLAAQGGYAKVHIQDRTLAQFDQHGWRWLTSGSVKVGDAGFWLGATYGNANGTTTKLHDKTFLLSIFLSPPNASGVLGNGAATKTSK